MRIVRLFPALLVPVLLAAGCGPAGAPASPTGPVVSTPPAATAPGPTGVPGGGLPTDPATLVAAGAAADGTRVSVRATYYQDATGRFLCGALAESYPPRCGADRLVFVGDLPADILAGMDSTRGQPDLAQVTWGVVVATGVFRAGTADEPPALLVEEVTRP